MLSGEKSGQQRVRGRNVKSSEKIYAEFTFKLAVQNNVTLKKYTAVY